MDIIEAHWEQVNLNLKSYEISIGDKDAVDDFKRIEQSLIQENQARYILAKTPVNKPDFLFNLPAMGYTFVECVFRLSLHKTKFVEPDHFSKYAKQLACRKISEQADVQRIYSEISKGIFDTDRIAIDKNFTLEISNRRYINWIDSLVKSGEALYEVSLKESPIGFFILKPMTTTVVRGVLTGLYTKFRNSGLGILIMKKLNETVWELGYDTYLAHVASNNPKALRSNLIFGSEIEEMGYNYVKVIPS